MDQPEPPPGQFRMISIETPGVGLVPVVAGAEWTITHHRLFDVDPANADDVEVVGGDFTAWDLMFGSTLLVAEKVDRSLMLDVGWNPQHDPAGRYHVTLMRQATHQMRPHIPANRVVHDWDDPVFEESTRSLPRVLELIDRLLSAS